MMVSSVKKDTRYELRDTDMSGLSDLYFPQDDKGPAGLDDHRRSAARHGSLWPKRG